MRFGLIRIVLWLQPYSS